MAFTDTYKVQMTRTEYIEVVVTDGTEYDVWEALSLGWADYDITRADYDDMPDNEKAEFLARYAIELGLDDYAETTGEQLTLFDIMKE